MPKPSSQPMYVTASRLLAACSTSGVPRQTGAVSTATAVSASAKTGSASGSSSREAPKDAVMATPATSAKPRSTGRPARSNSRSSSHSAVALAMTTSVLNIQPGALITMSRKTGNSTSALAIRFTSADLRGAPSARLAAGVAATSHPTEAAGPPLKIGDGAVQVAGAEIRPQGRRHPQLGVRDLPQQEVRDAHLAAGPDEQIRVRDPIRVKRLADVRLRDLLGPELARAHAPGERPEGVEQLVPAAVVERHQQGQPGVGLR